ncbi:hypothetical protein [Streptomyces beijiangensis]|uniref:Secreted protein n=1 Tax=Streptomyces beijiangensis TaxID=163361 RepID=A0A939F8B6_9ACTN|nr:hypothetical protein [Streptomyces beijiangensis]MBO0513504.1 hypothetical protein [Streptomyces beijiangensis]
MEAVVAILVLLFVAFVALGVFVTVKVVTAAKRGVERTVTQARRTVEDTALRAKSYGQPGVSGEISQLRLSLRTSMRATQDALQAAVAEDTTLQESLGLFGRLSAHGHELDEELRRLEREPDKVRLGERLPGLRERTERITHSAESLRWATRDRARRFADDDLEMLTAQIDVEAGALRHWAAVEPEGEAAAKPWPPAQDGRGAPAQTWPDEQSGAPDAPQPQSITGRDRNQPRTTYPWQKSARPEGTV